jgi:hypothetical protein
MNSKISYQPGHGWEKLGSKVRGGYSGGVGTNPAPRWDGISTFCVPLGRDPKEGDIIDWTFSHPVWTPKALARLGLTCRKGEIKKIYQAVRNSLGGYEIVDTWNDQGTIIGIGTWEECQDLIEDDKLS